MCARIKGSRAATALPTVWLAGGGVKVEEEQERYV